MSTPSLILFDLDDTLCDYSGARSGRLQGAFSRALSASDVTISNLDDLVAESIQIHPHGSEHFPDLLARHGVTDLELQQGARRWYHENRFLGLHLYPDALAVLYKVRTIPGVRAIGLITNGPAEIQRDKIERLGLWPHIDFAVISGEVGIEKPDPAIFHEALRIGHAIPAHAVYIGDSPEFDIEGARAAGIPQVWVNQLHQPWPGNPPSPDYTIATLNQLPPLIANL